MNAESHRGASTAFVHITDILGDRWTPLVLCAAFLGLRRFDEIQSGLEIATNILTHRLNYLVDHQASSSGGSIPSGRRATNIGSRRRAATCIRTR